MPYAPGIQYRGDQYIAQGLSEAGDALADGIKRFKDERKQAKAVDTALGTVGTMVEKMVEQRVLTPDFLAKFKGAASGTTEQKRAALESFGMVLKFADQAQTMQARNEAMRVQGEQLNLAKLASERQGTELGAQRKYAQTLAQRLTPYWSGDQQQIVTPEFTPALATQAAAEAGAGISPETTPALMHYAPRAPWQPTISQVGGRTVIQTGPNQAQVLPATGGGEGGVQKAASLVDAEGNVLAQGFFDADGNFKPVSPSDRPVSTEARPIMLNGKPSDYILVGGQIKSKDGRMATVEALNALLLGGATVGTGGGGSRRRYNEETGRLE